VFPLAAQAGEHNASIFGVYPRNMTVSMVLLPFQPAFTKNRYFYQVFGRIVPRTTRKKKPRRGGASMTLMSNQFLLNYRRC
jgi:hypothetical protein